jgi:hypothetical protein
MKRMAMVGLMLGFGCSGEPPAGDVCKDRKAGDLVITEVMVDPDGADTGNEWIEVFNTLDAPIDLKGVTLFVGEPDGTTQKTHVIRAGVVPARSYFVVGDSRSGPNPAWVNYSYGDSLSALSNARGAIGIKCGQTIAQYTWTSAVKAGRSRMLDGAQEPNATTASQEMNYCDSPVGSPYFGNNVGTPGLPNVPCEITAGGGTCLENGAARPIVAPQSGDLLITEVMASPRATTDSTGEWIEVRARASVDLNNLTIATTGSSTRISSMSCLPVTAGDFALLARSNDAFVNGGLPTPKAVYGSLTFADTTNQRIAILLGDAGIDDVALFPSTSGRSWQLDQNKLDPVSNKDPNNFCRSTKPWSLDGGGDLGSPAAANEVCPAIVDAGLIDGVSCVDAITQQSRPIRFAKAGELEFSEVLPDPDAVSDANGEYIEFNAKTDIDLNGLTLQVGTTKTLLESPSCLAAPRDTFPLFGKNRIAAENGNLPNVTGLFAGSLVNGGGTLSLLGVDGGTFSTVTYPGSSPGTSIQVSDAGLCDTPASVRITLTDGGVGDRGTPGQANVACP